MSAPKTTNCPPITWEPLRYQTGALIPLAIRPDASVFDVANWLDTRLGMLDAMLQLTYGGAPVIGLPDAERGFYLWACSELASECRALHSELFRVGSFEAKGGEV